MYLPTNLLNYLLNNITAMFKLTYCSKISFYFLLSQRNSAFVYNFDTVWGFEIFCLQHETKHTTNERNFENERNKIAFRCLIVAKRTSKRNEIITETKVNKIAFHEFKRKRKRKRRKSGAKLHPWSSLSADYFSR